MEDLKIEALKRKHGEIFQIDVEGEKPFVLKKPDLACVSAYAKLVNTDSIKAAQVVLNSCIIEGDKTKLEEPEVLLSLVKHVNSLMTTRRSTIKKL